MRLTDNDWTIGPLTIGRARSSRFLSIAYHSSGGDEDGEEPRWNAIHLRCFGLIARLWLPNLIGPHRVRHVANWDAETVARLGRNHYDICTTREFGFRLFEGHFSILYGAQTGDSRTEKRWSKFLPWTQWRHVRFSLYAPDGSHFWTRLNARRKHPAHSFDQQLEQTNAVPKECFEFDDFDGARIIATCHIEEREWRFGDGWFSWLSMFRRPRIRRSLGIEFSAEVGPEKGSWKGGTIGHSTEIAKGESCESAFRRYCERERISRDGSYRLTFVGKAAEKDGAE